MGGGAAVCDRCGRSSHDPSTTWSSSSGPDGVRWLCGTCTREHLRAIEARLDEQWWEPPTGSS